MVTITLVSNKEKSFNLPSFKREKELLAAWKAMRDDSKYAKKYFQFNCTNGTRLKVRIPDIKDIFFEEAIAADAMPTTKDEIKQMTREKLGQASDAVIDNAHDLMSTAKKMAKDALEKARQKSGGKNEPNSNERQQAI